ncbi:hypothetical protein L5515_001909 [Caenorhabditis briggsae]|uniref:Uncharacterized protein n=1 Tax=Caenorhabditis briggsae TaxID=6238 RepID=A0AAE9E415_CAEBR|nr:hypothetical protein L5515_001909 [Caenorhabditis briggsae]
MDKQKPAKKSATTSSRNKTQRKAKVKPCAVMSNVSSKKSSNTPNRKAASKSAPPVSPREEKKDGPPTVREKKKEEKKEKVTPIKKKPEPEKPEKKLDRTQDDDKETESGLSSVVNEVNVPVKMDDGYEDFGPGANNQ